MIPTGRWPGFVARIATHAPPSVFADELANGWPAVVGGEIPGGILLAMLAQIMLETATRQIDRDHDGDVDAKDQLDGCWNGNVGNIRGRYFNDPPPAVGWWTSFRAGEGYGANETILEPGLENKFRSYIGPDESPDDPATLRKAIERGVRDMISLLIRKYPKALAAARRRDYHAYVHELREGGYFTASESSYDAAESKLRLTVDDELAQVAAFLAEGRET